MEQIEKSDVEQIVRLVAQAGDPTVEAPIPARKRALVEGVAQLIDADVWFWNTSALEPGALDNVAPICVIDGGWQNDQERARAVEVLCDPLFNELTTRELHSAVVRNEYATYSRAQLVPDDEWARVSNSWFATGLRHMLISIYPLGDLLFSGLGFHRRADKPDFGERERCIVHTVFGQIDWLHRHGTNVPVAQQTLQLSPREREVLVYVLGGDSRKEIAHKLNLSEHTVGDYLKRLHKHYGVKSRAELLSRFIAGGQ